MREEQTGYDALQRIVSDWIEEGFTTPPYPPAYYTVFETLCLNPDDFHTDITRPEPDVDGAGRTPAMYRQGT